MRALGQDKTTNLRFMLTGVLIGGGVSVYLGFVAYAAAFGICADPSLAELLFPGYLFAGPSGQNQALLLLISVLTQYPIYGAVAGAIYSRVREQNDLDLFLKIFVSILPLFPLHLLAYALAKHTVNI